MVANEVCLLKWRHSGMLVTGRFRGGQSTLVVDCIPVVSGCSYVRASRFLVDGGVLHQVGVIKGSV